MTMSIEGAIAIISTISISIIAIIKLLSTACFQSKCVKVKCCCNLMEIDRNVTAEQANITFDENNNIPQQHSTIQQPQDIHISIDRSPTIPTRKLDEIK